MKIFQLFTNDGTIYFPTRGECKDYMRAIGRHLTIHRGPDHWRGETDGTFTQTVSSKDKGGW